MRSQRDILILVRDRYNIGISGLCAASFLLYREEVFSKAEFDGFLSFWEAYAEDHVWFYKYDLGEMQKTKDKKMTYGWSAHSKEGRIEWINNQIRRLWDT